MSKVLKSTHEGYLNIGDVTVDVAVLEDGKRIITQSGVFKALDRPVRGTTRIDQVPTFMDAKSLQPFVNEELSQVINKVEFINKDGKKSDGYDATILPLVADLYLKARENKVLSKSQEDTAIKAEILVRSLAKVGIIALVDEATGYQYERELNELQKILSKYISEELLPWQKRFPDEYYKEIFRLNNWDFTVSGIKKRPGVVGTWTKKLVYNMLPSGVLKELEQKTPKSKSGNKTARLHQSLTLDIGEPHLEKQLNSVITLMNVSDSWQEFERLFQKKFGQQELAFPDPKDEPNNLISSGNKDLDKSVSKALKKGKPKN